MIGPDRVGLKSEELSTARACRSGARGTGHRSCWSSVQLGAPDEATRLVPFVTPRVCVFEFGRPDGSAASGNVG